MKSIIHSLRRWFDAESPVGIEAGKRNDKVDWVGAIPFILVHLVCLSVLWVGWSPVAVATAIAFYWIRMFAITGFYHRYFSHRTFRTSRGGQFVLGLMGMTAMQRGPLWWAAHHRKHHQHSDQETDPHSPVQHGLLWSHMGWFTNRNNFPTDLRVVRDLAQFPELRLLNRFDFLVPTLLAIGMFFFGKGLQVYWPSTGTSGWQMLVWGFFISTVVLFHGTCLINSMAHVFGRKRFGTDDESRNSLLLALITLGEGWHNNHHHFPASTRQGFYWWEIDITYYLLKALSWTGLIWALRPVPERVLRQGRLEPGQP